MNIAFLCCEWPVSGGIETVTRTLANELVARNHRVVVICTKKTFRSPMPFVDSRISTEIFNNETLNGDEARIFIEKCVTKWQLNVLINQCFPTWRANVLNCLNGKVLIIECLHMTLFYPSSYHKLGWKKHDIKMRLLGPWLYNRQEKRKRCEAIEAEFPLVDFFVVLSESYVKEYHQFRGYRDKGKLVFMSNPLAKTVSLTEEQFLAKEKTVLCVSRMSESEKHISYMIEAWKAIEADNHFDAWRFDVVGEGPSLADYQHTARQYGLQRIKFHGYQDPSTFYIQSRILLITSPAEGWPMTIVEGQQAGVVPIAMNTFSSLHDTISDRQNGRITPANDIVKFIDIMKQTMTDDQGRNTMARNAMATCRRFQVGVIASRWEKLFDSKKDGDHK